MYNNIGLQTARGSGTNGYVQVNRANLLVLKKEIKYNAESDIKRMEAEINRKPDPGIIDHNNKRVIEIKVEELGDELEKKGVSVEEIEKEKEKYRNELMKKYQKGQLDVSPFVKTNDTHLNAVLAAKMRDRMRDAFGIDSNYTNGSSFAKMNNNYGQITIEEVEQDEKNDVLASKEKVKKVREESPSSSSSSSSSESSDDSGSFSDSNDHPSEASSSEQNSSKTSSEDDEKRHKSSDIDRKNIQSNRRRRRNDAEDLLDEISRKRRVSDEKDRERQWRHKNNDERNPRYIPGRNADHCSYDKRSHYPPFRNRYNDRNIYNDEYIRQKCDNGQRSERRRRRSKSDRRDNSDHYSKKRAGDERYLRYPREHQRRSEKYRTNRDSSLSLKRTAKHRRNSSSSTESSEYQFRKDLQLNRSRVNEKDDTGVSHAVQRNEKSERSSRESNVSLKADDLEKTRNKSDNRSHRSSPVGTDRANNAEKALKDESSKKNGSPNIHSGIVTAEKVDEINLSVKSLQNSSDQTSDTNYESDSDPFSHSSDYRTVRSSVVVAKH